MLVVTERRVDGDGSAQQGGGDEYLDVRAPDAVAVDPAVADVVWLCDGRVQAGAATT